MPEKNSGKTRAPKKPGRHTAGRMKFSRRKLLVMGAVLAASALPTPAVKELKAAEPVVHDGRPSDRLTRLADLWDAAACNFDVVRQDVFFGASSGGRGETHGSDSPGMRRYRESARTMFAYADAVFREPSRKEADVLLKYDLMTELLDARHVPDVDMIREAGGGDWHRIVEREMEMFGLKLNRLWLWENPRTAMIEDKPQAAISNRIRHRRKSLA